MQEKGNVPMTQKHKIEQKSQIPTYKPPVVVVMGHVDHGKTTLLDYIRKSRIAAGEHGQITQHIGAYQVAVNEEAITFIDTPGHEAFANLRSRGARVADIALLVIDASESVKPQTVESIKIIKEAKVPVIVVMTKIDLPNAQPKKVITDLLRYDVITEKNGGNIASVEISAKTGKGIPDLLDTILLVAQLKKLTDVKPGPFAGVVIESRKDKGKGNVGSVLVLQGTVRIGDTVYHGDSSFRVRAMFDDFGKSISAASAGKPVELLGFTGIPVVGSMISASRESKQLLVPARPTTPEKSTEDTVLSILLKADTQGSLEAVMEGMPEGVHIGQAGIGEITENDVSYAKTTGLVIIGFNVDAHDRVKKIAKEEGVRMRTYTIIYKLFEEITEVIGVLRQGPQRNILGQAKILQEFMYEGSRIAGCQVVEGRIAKGDTVFLVRSNEELPETARIISVRQQKDEVTKVEKGKVCGVRFSKPIDFRIGDMVQSYTSYEL